MWNWERKQLRSRKNILLVRWEMMYFNVHLCLGLHIGQFVERLQKFFNEY